MNCFDHIIIGGGVIGSSVAFELAKRGHSVAILDRGKAGNESSSAAAGLLGVQAEWDEYDPLFDLARKSRALFPELAAILRERSGIDIGYEEKGIYKIAETAEEMNKLQKTAKWQEETGEDTVILNGNELRERETGISKNVIGAVYYPKDGHVMAPSLTKAFLQSAIYYGAELHEYTKVEELLFEKRKTAGVRTEAGMLYSDNVIISSGAWSNPFLKHFGRLKTFPVKGEMICLKSKKPLLTSPIYKNGWYLVPKRGGRILVGATVKSHDFSKHVEAKGVNDLLNTAKRILPEMEQAEWDGAWAGLRPHTDHRAPYMEKHPEIEGLYACTGHFRNGILLSPVTGIYMADLIEGKQSNLLKKAIFSKG